MACRFRQSTGLCVRVKKEQAEKKTFSNGRFKAYGNGHGHAPQELREPHASFAHERNDLAAAPDNPSPVDLRAKFYKENTLKNKKKFFLCLTTKKFDVLLSTRFENKVLLFHFGRTTENVFPRSTPLSAARERKKSQTGLTNF